MTCARVLGVVPSLLVLAAVPAAGQSRASGRTAVFFESYDFPKPDSGPGLVFDRVGELTIPIGLTYDLGRLGSLALSAGYARVTLRSADTARLANQEVSGPLDTEVRLSLNVVPGKAVVLLTGALPTGTKSVEQQELSVLGAISSDVIGFAVSSLGTGGNLGAGFAGALPLGRWAAGFGGSFKQPLGYQPVLGESRQLKPGSEVRLRGGLEGPLGRRTYLRLAGILARTAKDRVAIGGSDSVRNGVGNRFITYLSVNQGIGRLGITAYGFDVLRGDPQIEQTAQGAAILPRGNVLALGGRVDVPLGAATTLTPNAEWRVSDAAPDAKTKALERLGGSLRLALDLRHRLSPMVSLVLQGGRTSGYVYQAGNRVDLSGFRVATHLEITP
jgi:hypothetical protein